MAKEPIPPDKSVNLHYYNNVFLLAGEQELRVNQSQNHTQKITVFETGITIIIIGTFSLTEIMSQQS